MKNVFGLTSVNVREEVKNNEGQTISIFAGKTIYEQNQTYNRSLELEEVSTVEYLYDTKLITFNYDDTKITTLVQETEGNIISSVLGTDGELVKTYSKNDKVILDKDNFKDILHTEQYKESKLSRIIRHNKYELTVYDNGFSANKVLREYINIKKYFNDFNISISNHGVLVNKEVNGLEYRFRFKLKELVEHLINVDLDNCDFEKEYRQYRSFIKKFIYESNKLTKSNICDECKPYFNPDNKTEFKIKHKNYSCKIISDVNNNIAINNCIQKFKYDDIEIFVGIFGFQVYDKVNSIHYSFKFNNLERSISYLIDNLIDNLKIIKFQ